MVHGGDWCALGNTVPCKGISNSAMGTHGAGLPIPQEKLEVRI